MLGLAYVTGLTAFIGSVTLVEWLLVAIVLLLMQIAALLRTKK